MDGFRVETTLLAHSGLRYYAVGRQLSEVVDRLRRLQRTLGAQTIGDEAPALLRSAIAALEEAARQSRDFGVQCEEIADVYEHVERQVAALVAALPSAPPFSPAATGGYTANVAVLQGARVESLYRPTKPVMLSGNRLPCESWLLDRAIKASFDDESR